MFLALKGNHQENPPGKQKSSKTNAWGWGVPETSPAHLGPLNNRPPLPSSTRLAPTSGRGSERRRLLGGLLLVELLRLKR